MLVQCLETETAIAGLKKRSHQKPFGLADDAAAFGTLLVLSSYPASFRDIRYEWSASFFPRCCYDAAALGNGQHAVGTVVVSRIVSRYPMRMVRGLLSTLLLPVMQRRWNGCRRKWN